MNNIIHGVTVVVDDDLAESVAKEMASNPRNMLTTIFDENGDVTDCMTHILEYYQNDKKALADISEAVQAYRGGDYALAEAANRGTLDDLFTSLADVLTTDRMNGLTDLFLQRGLEDADASDLEEILDQFANSRAYEVMVERIADNAVDDLNLEKLVRIAHDNHDLDQFADEVLPYVDAEYVPFGTAFEHAASAVKRATSDCSILDYIDDSQASAIAQRILTELHGEGGSLLNQAIHVIKTHFKEQPDEAVGIVLSLVGELSEADQAEFGFGKPTAPVAAPFMFSTPEFDVQFSVTPRKTEAA